MINWDSSDGVRDVIRKKMSQHAPKIILELGTFAARGTEAMAKYVSSYTKDAVQIFTIDAGVPLDWAVATKTYLPKKIGGWDAVVKMRKHRLNKRYPFCEITYIEGSTIDVLPNLMDRVKTWDFCFHDATHLPETMLIDFDLIEPFSHSGSVIIFDDADGNFQKIFPVHTKGEWEIEIVSDSSDPGKPSKILIGVRK